MVLRDYFQEIMLNHVCEPNNYYYIIIIIPINPQYYQIVIMLTVFVKLSYELSFYFNRILPLNYGLFKKYTFVYLIFN